MPAIASLASGVQTPTLAISADSDIDADQHRLLGDVIHGFTVVFNSPSAAGTVATDSEGCQWIKVTVSGGTGRFYLRWIAKDIGINGLE